MVTVGVKAGHGVMSKEWWCWVSGTGREKKKNVRSCFGGELYACRWQGRWKVAIRNTEKEEVRLSVTTEYNDNGRMSNALNEAELLGVRGSGGGGGGSKVT